MFAIQVALIGWTGICWTFECHTSSAG